MELDDLKKSWSVLDKQLQKENIIDEDQVSKLIAKYQAGAKKNMNSITDFQKTSLIAGGAIAVGAIIATSIINGVTVGLKEIVLASYVLIAIVFGLLWDIKTYRWIRNINIEEMPTVKVIERINTFRKLMQYEAIAAGIWIVIFLALFYWVQGFYTYPVAKQLAFLFMMLFIMAGVIYFLYSKIGRHIDDVKKNMEELKELES